MILPCTSIPTSTYKVSETKFGHCQSGSEPVVKKEILREGGKVRKHVQTSITNSPDCTSGFAMALGKNRRGGTDWGPLFLVLGPF